MQPVTSSNRERMSILRLIHAVVLLAAISFARPAAAASLQTGAVVGGTSTTPTLTGAAISSPAPYYPVGGNFSIYAQAQAASSYGMLRAGSFVVSAPGHLCDAAAVARWTDTITLTGGSTTIGGVPTPVPVGTPLSMMVRVTLHCTASSFDPASWSASLVPADNYVQASYAVRLFENGIQLQEFKGDWTSPRYPYIGTGGQTFGAGIFSGTAPGDFTSSVGVFSGTPLSLAVQLETAATTGYGFGNVSTSPADFANASADFRNTLVWDGVVEVRDGSGNLVTGYSLASATGINWTQPVPEPLSSVLLLASLPLLAVRRMFPRKRSGLYDTR